MIEKINLSEKNNSKREEKINIPDNYPPKKSLMESVGNSLRRFGNDVKSFVGNNETLKKKTTESQEFLTKMFGFFHGIDIEKGTEIKNADDVKKIREIFLPIIDLNETGVEFSSGDFIRYDKKTGNVEFYPIDSKKQVGNVLKGSVPISERTIPYPPSKNYEAYNLDKYGKNIANTLAKFVKDSGPVKSGPDSCGKSVRLMLEKFGMKNPPRGHGNQWEGMMKNDSRFKKVEVNSFHEIPVGGILTFSGKGKLNGKPHGSSMNQKYGHVEIKDANGNFTSFYSSVRAGGSAKAPSLINDFQKWKEATGFTGVYIPISKTKEEALKIRNEEKKLG